MKFMDGSPRTKTAALVDDAARALYVGMQTGGVQAPPHRNRKMTDTTNPPAPDEAPRRPLTPEAQRALAEAQDRREKAETARQQAAKEINGRGGLDPVRYGDWEVKGLTSDF
jgi:hypothetical protein